MGAWGTGSFDNDDAMDFVGDYEEGGVDVVTRAFADLSTEAETGFIDVPTACIALAAAEIVANAFGSPREDLPDTVIAVLDRHAEGIAEETGLKASAVEAAEAVLAGADTSELYDLWADTDELSDWKEDVGDLVTRLQEAGS